MVIWQNESYDYAAMHGASSSGVNPYQDGKYAVTVKLAFSTTWTATSDYIQIESINLGVIAVIPAHTATGVMYAAAPIVFGVGTIGVIDADTVDDSNLQRQIIHRDRKSVV